MYRLKRRFSGKRTVSCTYEFGGVNPSATKWRRGDYNNGESPYHYHYPSSSPSSSCGMGWTMPVQAQLFINKRPLNWEPCATSRSRRILHQRRIMSSLFSQPSAICTSPSIISRLSIFAWESLLAVIYWFRIWIYIIFSIHSIQLQWTSL